MHYKLINDIEKYYDDRNLINILKNIITNPIESRYGIHNPITGIPLRGPLSQFFSGIYLKPLDDAFDHLDVTYLRYQDDILILCKTKRQLNRCKRLMMNILYERGLKLSRRKTRMGKIELGFHFLGVTYPPNLPTRTADHTDNPSVDKPIDLDLDLNVNIQSMQSMDHTAVPLQIVPHARTLRKAREQVRLMVIDKVSLSRTRLYLFRWVCWWARVSSVWKQKQLLDWFVKACRDEHVKAVAYAVHQHYFTKLHSDTSRAETASGCVV